MTTRCTWQEGKHVVVDNTHPDKESRQRYIEVAKKLGASVRCFILNVSKDHARHNNKVCVNVRLLSLKNIVVVFWYNLIYINWSFYFKGCLFSVLALLYVKPQNLSLFLAFEIFSIPVSRI